MSRKLFGPLCLAVILCAGCVKKAARHQSAVQVDVAQTNGTDWVEFQPLARETTVSFHTNLGGIAFGSGGGNGVAFAASRFVAIRHKLEIIEPGTNLPKSVDAVVAFCGTIQCELLSSNVTNETTVLSPAATIAARVAPQDLNKFLDFVGKQGKIAQRATESEDKTAAVIDVEAKIKNQTEFRDSLRKMLTRPGVSVADLLQIQEKLADAQSELDAEATQRKVLANETEKVAVEVEFRSEQRTVHRSAFASVGEAFHDFASVLSDSLAALITAIAAIIPWLIVIVPGVWLLVKAVKKWRKNRAAKIAPVPPTT